MHSIGQLKRLVIAVVLGALVSLAGCEPPVIFNPTRVVIQPPPVVVLAPKVVIYQLPDLRGCVAIKAGDARGSGVVAAQRGRTYFVLTAKHVIEHGGPITVDGFPATVYVQSGEDDIALLKFTPDKTYTVYPTAEGRLGERCWAVGFPMMPPTPPRIRHTQKRFVHPGHITRYTEEELWHNGGGARGFSGGAILGVRDGKPVLLGIVTGVFGYDRLHVNESICRGESFNPMQSLLFWIPVKPLTPTTKPSKIEEIEKKPTDPTTQPIQREQAEPDMKDAHNGLTPYQGTAGDQVILGT